MVQQEVQVLRFGLTRPSIQSDLQVQSSHSGCNHGLRQTSGESTLRGIRVASETPLGCSSGLDRLVTVQVD